MRLKTFKTHTLAIIKDVKALELEFNVWTIEQKPKSILKMEYQVQQRVNAHGTKYEELILFVIYKQ